MTGAVKEVATAIRESNPLDIHPDLYTAVMDQGGFSQEALMAALSHLLDSKARVLGLLPCRSSQGALAQELAGQALLLVLYNWWWGPHA